MQDVGAFNVKRAILLLSALLALAPLLFAAPAAAGSPTTSLEAQRNQGLLVTRVIPNSPAQQAGLVRGDIIVELGGQKVTTPNDVRRVLASHNAGDTIVAVVIHGSRTERVPIKLETRLYHPILGVDFSRGGAGSKGAQQGKPGAYVDSVVPGGPAAQAGIQPGDVILSVNGTPVDQSNPLITIIHGYPAGSRISVRVRQPSGQRLTLSVRLGKSASGGALLGLRYSKVPASSSQSGIEKFFHNFGHLEHFAPPKWFRSFGESLFPKQLKGGSGSGQSGAGGSGAGSA